MNITASVKGVIQRGIAQVQVKNGHLFVTLTDGTELDLGLVAGRGITNAAVQSGRLVLTFSDGVRKDVGTVAGRGITQAQVQGDDLVLSFSDGSSQNAGSVRGRGLSQARVEEDHLILVYTDGATQNVGPIKNRGIRSIAKTGTAGKTDTYTVTYTDGTTWSYTVQNGADCTFDGNLDRDLCLKGSGLRFQTPTGTDRIRLTAEPDRDGTLRLGTGAQSIRIGSLAAPQEDTDAVSRGYVQALLASSVNVMDRLIGGDA